MEGVHFSVKVMTAMKGGRALGAPGISEAHEFQVFFHSFS